MGITTRGGCMGGKGERQKKEARRDGGWVSGAREQGGAVMELEQRIAVSVARFVVCLSSSPDVLLCRLWCRVQLVAVVCFDLFVPRNGCQYGIPVLQLDSQLKFAIRIDP